MERESPLPPGLKTDEDALAPSGEALEAGAPTPAREPASPWLRRVALLGLVGFLFAAFVPTWFAADFVPTGWQAAIPYVLIGIAVLVAAAFVVSIVVYAVDGDDEGPVAGPANFLFAFFDFMQSEHLGRGRFSLWDLWD